jgi:hypothetical protein
MFAGQAFLIDIGIPLLGAKRPAFNFAGADLLAHGLNFGLQLEF